MSDLSLSTSNAAGRLLLLPLLPRSSPRFQRAIARTADESHSACTHEATSGALHLLILLRYLPLYRALKSPNDFEEGTPKLYDVEH